MNKMTTQNHGQWSGSTSVKGGQGQSIKWGKGIILLLQNHFWSYFMPLICIFFSTGLCVHSYYWYAYIVGVQAKNTEKGRSFLGHVLTKTWLMTNLHWPDFRTRMSISRIMLANSFRCRILERALLLLCEKAGGMNFQQKLLMSPSRKIRLGRIQGNVLGHWTESGKS
jgi:hypothetical protein